MKAAFDLHQHQGRGGGIDELSKRRMLARKDRRHTGPCPLLFDFMRPPEDRYCFSSEVIVVGVLPAVDHEGHAAVSDHIAVIHRRLRRCEQQCPAIGREGERH